MTEDEILQTFRKHSALLEGHFILSSGLHSDRYIQCALVLQHPPVAEQLCSELAAKLRYLRASAVAAPALGGVIVAHEVARALGVRAVFTERQDGVMALRRGFSFAAAEPIIVVEDVMTTGGATPETTTCGERGGGRGGRGGAPVGPRDGPHRWGLPQLPRPHLYARDYEPAGRPLCKEGTTGTKTGRR